MLSLVTGKLGRDESFARLVSSIVKHTTSDWELVVSDASPTTFVSNDPRIRILPEKPRLGHSRGYNKAFRECRGTWCLWLNDDAEVCANYDTEAIRFMEAHPRIGLGALHYCDPGEEFHVNSAFGAIYANFGILRRVDGESIGWLDPEITMYGADNSIAIRMLLSGKGIADIPKARIIHHSVKDQTRVDNQKNRMRDNQILTQKYMSSRAQWQRTFKELEVKTGTVPWSHGVKPEKVLA